MKAPTPNNIPGGKRITRDIRNAGGKVVGGAKDLFDKGKKYADPIKGPARLYDKVFGGGIDYHRRPTSNGGTINVRENPFKQAPRRGFNAPHWEAYEKDRKLIGNAAAKERHIIGPTLAHQQRMRRADPERMRNQPWSSFKPQKSLKPTPPRAGSGTTFARG